MATRRNVTGSVNTTGRTPIQYPPEPEFTSNLTSSLIPSASVGPITYSRATAATVLDHEGIVRYAKSGEARFQGARRVENLFSYSEDASSGYWYKQRASITANAIAGPSGNLIADLVVGTIAGTSYIYAPMSVISGNKYRVSVCVKAADITNFSITSFTQIGSCAFDLTLGTAGTPTGITSSPTMTNLGNGWYRCSLLLTANATGSNNIGFVSQSYVGNICYVCEMQMEDVTGQSDTSFGEYVSTNVLSSPFHGAMVDGVKYFDTDINGNPIPENTLKGFLCEGARTNLFLQSEDFLTTWATDGGSMTTNIGIAPDGRMTATLFTLGATLGSQRVTQSVTTTAAVYAQSIYVKPNGQNYIQCNAAGGISIGYVNFDLSNGTVGTQSLWTGTIESLPNGWYRIKVITNTISATTANVGFSAVPSSTATRGQTVAGTGTSGFYIWGAQFELGPSASSYIPTTTVAVTRNMDVLTYDVRNAIANQGAFSAVFTMDDNAIFDRRALNFSYANNNRFQFQTRRNGLPYANLIIGTGSTTSSVTTTQEIGTNNVAVSWTNGVGAYVFMNNTKYSSVAVPNMIFSMVDVGGGNSTFPIFGCVKNVRIWKTVPTDTELLFLSNNP